MTGVIGQPYHKIPGPFKRHTEGPLRNRIDSTRFSSAEIADLAGFQWMWTEKIDGTNIRVHWDGYNVTFAGRTDRAQIPAPLFEYLETTFAEELLEQTFGGTAATLYGEGVGPKINGGARYSPHDPALILFDIQIGGVWLRREGVENVAQQLLIPYAPYAWTGSLDEAIDLVARGHRSAWGGFAEGLVGVPELGLLDRRGDRIITKVKHVDFYQGDPQ